jgi:hypothetical protein
MCFSKWVNGKRKKWNTVSECLCYVEAFADLHKIDISGFEYRYFCTKPPKIAFKINVHIYSAMLISNSIKFRWRLKYNEDVDLCLQVLHNGGRTASCVYYMTHKVTTAKKMKGGNQDELFILIKPLPDSKYRNMVDVLDEMAITGVKRYAIIDEFNEIDDLIIKQSGNRKPDAVKTANVVVPSSK